MCWLKNISTSIKRDLAKPAAGGTFEQALAEMRNEIVTGPTSNASNRSVGNANSLRGGRGGGHPYGGRGGRGDQGKANGRGGYGRGGRGGGGRGGNGNNKTRNHPDAYNITLMNGKKISAHPSYSFTNDEMANMHQNNKNAIFQQRQEYKARIAGGNAPPNQAHGVLTLSSSSTQIVLQMFTLTTVHTLQ